MKRKRRNCRPGALGLTWAGLGVFIVLLAFLAPLAWLPWVIPSLRRCRMD